jgi:DedD protein
MPLPKFLQRAATGPAPKKARAPLAADGAADDRSARHRLIGALVLLAVAVAVFSLVFDTEPRPLPMDTPMRAGEGAAEPAKPSAASSATKLPASPATADAAPKDPAKESSKEALKEAPKAEAAAEPPASAVAAPQEPVPEQPPSTAKVAALASSASSVAAASPAASKPAPAAAAEAGARYVIQVGAFSDAQALREARQRVEKLGLKTYTQVIESGGSTRTRVRVGPFASRDEAERVRAKLQAAKLPANLLTL